VLQRVLQRVLQCVSKEKASAPSVLQYVLQCVSQCVLQRVLQCVGKEEARAPSYLCRRINQLVCVFADSKKQPPKKGKSVKPKYEQIKKHL